MTSKTIKRARALRRQETPSEREVWACLRNRGQGGFRWKRQEPVGPYFADFFCPEVGLVVELDGRQHSENEQKDALRTRFLESHGLRVIRFWNYQVAEDLDAVSATIFAECERLKNRRAAGV